jgi:hypothetical protein
VPALAAGGRVVPSPRNHALRCAARLTYRPLTRTVLLARSGPASGPLSNSMRTTTAPVCALGTPTEAPQNVPQAKPDVAESSARPPASASTIFPAQPESEGPPVKCPR